MNRKETKLILISVLAVVMALNPVTGYPLTDFSVEQGIPDNIVAGNKFSVVCSYYNEDEPIDSKIVINITNVTQYNESQVSVSVNNDNVNCNETQPGFYETNTFKSDSEENRITSNIQTPINLRPDTYTFNITIHSEEYEERTHITRGRIIIPTPIPAKTPTPEEVPPRPTPPYPPTAPIATPPVPTATPTTTATELPTAPTTPTTTLEVPTPGFETGLAIIGLGAALYLLAKR